MPLKRKANFRSRRRVKRVRWPTKSTSNVGRSMVRRQVYSFNRSCGLISQAQSIAVGGIWTSALGFTLNSIPNVTEFQNLFDHYRLTYVKLYFQLQLTPEAAAASTAAYPVLYYARDYDDSLGPLSLDQLWEHGNMKRRVLQPNKLVTVGLRPATNSVVYRTALTNSYSPKWREWIDMANVDVPYYGLKFGVENWTTPGMGILVRAKYWFQCKNVR